MNKLLFAIATGLVAVGCGSDEGTSQGPGGSEIPENGIGPDGLIVKECQGFTLEGLHYSPGGTVLPNKCAPFHQTTNNPYAVRCIEAMRSFKTKYAGDEYCILPPPEDMGVQVGLHPQGRDYWSKIWAGDLSGYENVDPVWELGPGVEKTEDYRGGADNPEPHNYYRTYFRMRTGSHHQIISTHVTTPAPDQWMGRGQGGLFDSQGVYGTRNGILGGEQRPDDGTPMTLEKPAEDAGLYLEWPAKPSIVFNMHHFNTSKENPVLREVWANIWWEQDATKLVYWYMGLNGANTRMSVPPEQIQDFHYSWTINGNPRLLRVFGHRHFWTTNFSTWIERKDNPGNPELLYQSFNWQDMPTFRYDSVAQNPTPNADDHTDGASSGQVFLHTGDKLHFNCHVEYTAAHASRDPDAPSPADNANLRFGNEVYNREMCIQFGNVTDGILAFPAVDTTPLPDFATK